MTTMMSDRRRCFICGYVSEYPILTSTNTFGACDLDFRPPEMKRSTMPYWIQECPSCGYVAVDVSLSAPFPKYIRQLIASEDYRNCGDLRFRSDLAKQFYRQYFLALEKGDKQEALHAIHCAAWECDDTPGEEMNAKQCRLLALDVLENDHPHDMETEAEDDDYYEDDEKEEIKDLIKADLLRRTGQFEEVIAEYSKKQYETNKQFHSFAKYQVMLAMQQDDTCHRLDEALACFPLPKMVYYSVAVGDKSAKSFYYLGRDDGSAAEYAVGDLVVVPFGQNTRIGTVILVEEFDEDDVPFPLSSTKTIIGRYDTSVDHSARDYVPAATNCCSGLVGLLKLRNLIPEIHCSADDGYDWLGPQELCLYVSNPYQGDPLRIRLGDSFTLMYRGWEKVYDYPCASQDPDPRISEAKNEIAQRNYKKLCEQLLDFVDSILMVVLAYIGDQLIGGVMMNGTTAQRSSEAVLLSKITTDPATVLEAQKKGAHFVLASWMPMLDRKRTMEPQK